MEKQARAQPLDPAPMASLGGSAEGTEPYAPAAFRALANMTRLDVLRRLTAGRDSVEMIADDLGIETAAARRHLKALIRVGLVRSKSDGGAETYEPTGPATRLLSAVDRAPGGRGSPVIPLPTLRSSAPNPPLACTVCDNGAFVQSVLDDLESALGEARAYHQRIRDMSSQVLTAHEAERKRIARELHDDTAQALTSILVRLRLLERSSEEHEVLRNAEELRALTSVALDSVRRMAMDLRPAALDDLGLVPAIEAYAERYSRNWQVKASVEVKGVRRRLPPDVELVLYRVAQEALTNVAKHAAATTADVLLARRRNEVALSVEDDGAGFEIEDVERTPGEGLGLFGMRERLALVSGELQIESAVGSGTKVTARVPLAARRSRG